MRAAIEYVMSHARDETCVVYERSSFDGECWVIRALLWVAIAQVLAHRA